MIEQRLIASLIVLSLLGLANAAHIAWKRKRDMPLSCPLKQDCNAVIHSEWSRIFFIKNDTLGIIFYAIVVVIGFALFIFASATVLYSLVILSTFAFLFSIFLIYLQGYVLRNYCFHCLISSVLTTLVFVNSVVLFY